MKSYYIKNKSFILQKEKLRYRDPTIRQHKLDYVKKYSKTPNGIITERKRSKKRWQQPEYRAKIALYQKTPYYKRLKRSLDNLRRIKEKQRSPKWANIKAIHQFYRKCPKGYHVDHIIPLCGRLVSGLHVLNNLQYLSAGENSAKGNRFEPYTGYKPGDVMYVGN